MPALGYTLRKTYGGDVWKHTLNYQQAFYPVNIADVFADCSAVAKNNK